MTEPVVQIHTGQLQGVMDEDVAVFRGIPFAAPPLGDLRWQPPQPVAPWDGVRDASESGPASIQRGGDIQGFFNALVDGMGHNVFKRMLIRLILKFAPAPKDSEDCLYLNIRTPDVSADGLPVMVWIHGGDHQDGSGSEPFYDSNQLPKQGVVLVTVNYRLGLAGNFCHPELTSESPYRTCGNHGALDQIAALTWVRDNIASFGGDADNVTIFGESAGGESVAHMLTSPLSAGLFHRAILQSASNSAQMLHRDKEALQFRSAEAIGQDFATRIVGDVEQQVPLLRQLPIDALMNLVREESDRYPFYPVIDGHVLPRSPFECFRLGHQHKVPVMVGSNSDEGSVIFPMMGTPVIWRRHEDISSADVARLMTEDFGDDAARLFELYPGLAEGSEAAQSEFLGDNMFGAKAFYYASQHARAGEPTYFYYFSQVPPSETQSIGAFHAAEIPYVFGSGSMIFPIDESAGLSETMSRYWASFARAGSPNDNELPEWRECTEHAEEWMSLDGGARMAENTKTEQYQIMQRKLEQQLASLPTAG